MDQKWRDEVKKKREEKRNGKTKTDAASMHSMHLVYSVLSLLLQRHYFGRHMPFFCQVNKINKGVLRGNGFDPRTVSLTPLQHITTAQGDWSTSAVFGLAENYFSYTSFLIFVEVWDPRADRLLGQTHTHRHREDRAQHWHTMDNLQESVSLTGVCTECILSHTEGGAGREGIHFPEKAENSFGHPTKAGHCLLMSQYRDTWGKIRRNIGVEQKSHEKDQEKAKKVAENNYCVNNFK